MPKVNEQEGWDDISKEGDGYIINNEGYGLGTPVKAWAVETDGVIESWRVYGSRSQARIIHKSLKNLGYTKPRVRKIQIQVIPGR